MVTKKQPTTEELLDGVQQSAADVLAQLNDAMKSDFSDESIYGTAEVPASPVWKPTEDKVAQIVEPSILQGSSKGVSAAKMLKHYDPARFAAIEEAMQHQEKHLTQPSHYIHDGYEVRMPGAVRERPNSLYYRYNGKGERFPVREKADKILEAVFGDESKRVYEVCNRSGFVTNPLVFVSQQLYHHITNAVDHPYEQYAKDNNDPGFDETVDEAPGSSWIKALNMFLEAKTVKDLSKEARYRKMSVMTIMRCIMNDVCIDRGIPESWGK